MDFRSVGDQTAYTYAYTQVHTMHISRHTRKHTHTHTQYFTEPMPHPQWTGASCICSSWCNATSLSRHPLRLTALLSKVNSCFSATRHIATFMQPCTTRSTPQNILHAACPRSPVICSCSLARCSSTLPARPAVGLPVICSCSLARCSSTLPACGLLSSVPAVLPVAHLSPAPAVLPARSCCSSTCSCDGCS